MRREIMLAAAIVSSVAATPVLAKGCIRGAIVGGVAGHYVGRGHALAGAAVGCLVTSPLCSKGPGAADVAASLMPVSLSDLSRRRHGI